MFIYINNLYIYIKYIYLYNVSLFLYVSPVAFFLFTKETLNKKLYILYMESRKPLYFVDILYHYEAVYLI